MKTTSKGTKMSTKSFYAKAHYLLCYLALLIIVSCTTSIDDIQPDQTQTFTPTISLIMPTQTVKVIETAYPTATAILPTLTPVPTDTPIPKVTSIPTSEGLIVLPIPQTATLTPNEKAIILTELMQTNGGCELPCWWGIVLGESSITSTRKNLQEIGANWLGDNYASLGVEWGMIIEFEANNDIIQTMNIGSSYIPNIIDRDLYTKGWQRYNLTQILDNYSHPTQIFVYSPFRPDAGSGISYHLLIFYEDLGVVIEYRGNAEQLDRNQYRACPDLIDVWEIRLFLYQPSQIDNVVERILPADSLSYIADSKTVHELISWEQATGTSLDFFYETFREAEPNTCFEFVTD